MFDSRKLLDELMGAGAASPPASGGTAARPAAGSAAAGNGFAATIGSVLRQAREGLQDAARDVEARTGIGAKADQALKDATGGQGAGDLLTKARDLASQNKLATGAALGGLAAILLGTGAGRGIATTTAKLGGLALIGGLAYKALQNYQQGKPLVDMGDRVEPPPTDSPLGATADPEQDKNTALLLVRAMIAAASADGIVDNAERSHIVGSLERAGLDVAAAQFLDREFANPASIEALAAATPTLEIAAEVYTAARLAVEPDQPAEKQFLARLAEGLKLPPDLVAHIDAAARSASTQG